MPETSPQTPTIVGASVLSVTGSRLLSVKASTGDFLWTVGIACPFGSMADAAPIAIGSVVVIHCIGFGVVAFQTGG